jgi:putative CocE/NonD family hydrolase
MSGSISRLAGTRHTVLGALALACSATLHAQGNPYLGYPMTVEYDVRVPLRDGVHLSADIYRPGDDGRHPAIFQLTPYNNNNDRSVDGAWAFVRRGYAYVAVDVRGRYDSEGEYDPWYHDADDGSDVISWIAAQPWSNASVATIGASYSGMNQWLMARHNNPSHRAMVPYVAPADGFLDLVRWNGVPKVDLIYTWVMGQDGHVNQSSAGWAWSRVMWELPLNTLDHVVGRDVPTWQNWMEHDDLDDYWGPINTMGTYEDFDIPSFNVTGWFDGQVQGVTKHFRNAVRTGDASRHKLIIGPWLHGVNRNRSIGERDYGHLAIIPLDSIRDAWLDHHLLGEAAPALPSFLYFLPVKNEWYGAGGWPVPGTEFTAYHLASGGNANTLFGDGSLQGSPPNRDSPDEFEYDPANPVPTVSSRTAGARGGIAQGSVDNRAVETREDVLVYTSEVLDAGLEITGPVSATIYFSTDVTDTDITVKLLDVYPNGRALNLSHGIARARYRDSYSEPELLEPGQVYPIEVEMYPASNYFEPGHRIRVEVSSSNFPNLGRNLNTGNSSDTTAEMKVAHTRIHHSRQYPSHVLLPVVPQGATRGWQP